MPHAVDTPATSFDSLKLGGVNPANGSKITYPDYTTAPRPVSLDDFLKRAEEVSDLLGLDVAQRDNRNEVPYAQIQLLKDAGLVTALGPTRYGGGGLPFEASYKIQRIISRGDSSVGMILAYSYLWSWTAQIVGTQEQADALAKRVTEGRFILGGAVNPRDSDLTVAESEDGKSIVFNGKKAFSTGSKVSDLTVLEGVIKSTETHVFAIADSKQPGIKYGDDWVDVLGMRGSQSGSVTISDVRLPWSEALGFVDKTFVPLGAWNTLLLPAIQLQFINFYTGSAQGALKKGAQFTAKNTRGWPFAADPKQTGIEEFYIQALYGEWQAKLWALEAQVDQAGEIIGRLLARENRQITEEERGYAAVRIAAAKVTSTEFALEVTSKIYEALGSRSIALRAGFAHFFNNVRTHTLHDPVAHKKAQVGRYVLTGEYATPTWYTGGFAARDLFALAPTHGPLTTISMPPRGLKAAGKNKRTAATAFDPSAIGASGSSTAPASSSGSRDVSTTSEDGNVRTMPLDGDRLSVSDLFELRSSVVTLLSSWEEDKMEEARGLLRGILHGVQDLLPLVPKHHLGASPKAQEGNVDSNGRGKALAEEQAGEEDKKVELSDEQLRALGLVDKEQQTIALEAEPQLYYLQAWSLHHYALALPPPETYAQGKLLADETGKRRKLDPSESRDPSEWLALASEKYDEAQRWYACSGKDSCLSHLLVLADGNRCFADRAMFLLSKKEEAAASELMESGVRDLLPLVTRISLDGQQGEQMKVFFDERGDLIAVILRSIASVVASQEEVASLTQLAHSEKVCSELETILEPVKDGNGSWITAETALQWKFDLAIIRGDIALAQFGVSIEIVEDKYRPDATEDDEGDVEPLPVEAEEVKEAKRRGKEAIAKLQSTIELHSGLPAKKQIAIFKTEQYRKLEEAYLMYSALFNPDEEIKAQEIEVALTKIRAEDGHDQIS
ncbi:BQ2448_3096 [Microbotryum intermedium]|uniref:BQ2448_3096 protein n=1 Tax=Microbotryum intermedium TaxID=269621 RepID=A0A238FK15_9BASI|nr:BQ2448_3096 [Microbotryum intermedium]